jgi:hypothetical protein
VRYAMLLFMYPSSRHFLEAFCPSVQSAIGLGCFFPGRGPGFMTRLCALASCQHSLKCLPRCCL